MQCPRYQHENPPKAMFCLKCGAPVKPSAGGDASEASYPELQGSLSDALARERATGEILRVIGSSPADAQPVFETIARSGVSVCAALGCAVFVVDGDMLRVAATHGVRLDRLERFRAEYPIPLSAEVDTAQTVRQHHVVHLADIEHNPNATASDIEYAQLAGYRTRLMVPMVRGDRALGLIAVTREDPTPFPDQLVELLKHFADQAVIAIENVRLFKELKRRWSNRRRRARSCESSPTRRPTCGRLRRDRRNAVRLCGASSGGVYRFEGELVHSVAHDGYTLGQLAQLKATWPRPVTHPAWPARRFASRIGADPRHRNHHLPPAPQPGDAGQPPREGHSERDSCARCGGSARSSVRSAWAIATSMRSPRRRWIYSRRSPTRQSSRSRTCACSRSWRRATAT